LDRVTLDFEGHKFLPFAFYVGESLDRHGDDLVAASFVGSVCHGHAILQATDREAICVSLKHDGRLNAAERLSQDDPQLVDE
jgi:hypothetical protein